MVDEGDGRFLMSEVQWLLANKDTQRPLGGPMLLGTALPQDPEAARVRIRE